jgi:hypothetical protein
MVQDISKRTNTKIRIIRKGNLVYIKKRKRKTLGGIVIFAGMIYFYQLIMFIDRTTEKNITPWD